MGNTSGFLAKLDQAKEYLGASNILSPKDAKEFIDAHPEILILDVQDPGNDQIPGSYNASLGTLFFKASTDLEEFKDPKIADRPKDDEAYPIIVNCALGGQAILAGALLKEYGFNHVKVIEGGCVAWKKEHGSGNLFGF
eukprot:gnl/MRDRNA2_/MRDRNA2_144079_c0_seq1.p1 gnl/MRDRNA2_/MRDRNA2_144079_c0~~gnl/MRDRNA2_/MRDRNA2_144079_c0_seq1.p1  ORF type:complete len:139 (+),score=35.94 gnl/MRDRNA2_/MRDRNA2_144079_c0_seq1:83-499(+)